MFKKIQIKDWGADPEIVFRIIKRYENLSNDTEKSQMKGGLQ